MKKIIATTLIAAAAGIASAADVSVGVDFASAYVFRGAEFNDGLVVQPGAEISGFPIPEEFGSLAIGTWANMDLSDYDGAYDSGEFSEVDYYISYSLPVSVIDVSIGYCEYTYMAAGSSADRELSLGLGKAIGDSGVYSYFNAFYGVDGGIDEVAYLQTGLSYEIAASDALTLSADIALGYSAGGDEDGFNDLTSTLGASYALTERMSLNASLSYAAELDEDVCEVGTPVYGTVGVSYDF